MTTKPTDPGVDAKVEMDLQEVDFAHQESQDRKPLKRKLQNWVPGFQKKAKLISGKVQTEEIRVEHWKLIN